MADLAHAKEPAVNPDKPRLLDLFCGAGGAAMGYHRAGFDVVGVDIEPQPNYPFCFAMDDALDVLDELLNEGDVEAPPPGEVAYEEWAFTLADFTAIHASPPCQDYSKAMRHLSGEYPQLIEPVRDLLAATELPWIIENVEGSPLPVQSDLFGCHGVELCGSMFGLQMAGLQIHRHRLFETSFPIRAPRGCDHSLPAFNPHNADERGRPRIYAALGRANPEKSWAECMGVGWMGRYEAREAVPPAYTKYVGDRLLKALAEKAA
jgi:DNA (cytosine-5)-methyltransferase 1